MSSPGAVVSAPGAVSTRSLSVDIVKWLARLGDQAGVEPNKKEPVMLKTFATKIAAWRRYRDSVRELSRLSDRELSDLGIGRADIYDVVRQSVRNQA